MKNIIKKIIAIAISAVILALPMTASAADYDENKQTALSVGTKKYNINKAYAYTIFSFEPTEAAEYTFTAEGKLMGIASYNGMWVSSEPSATTVTEESVVWNCTGVGQSIWISVKTDKAASVSVTVTKQEKAKEEEIPYTTYINVHTPTPFTFEGDAEKLEPVDVWDGVDDQPFLGEDGLYHYKSETGPVLYVDLDDSLMNLVDAVGYGKLAYIGYDGDKIVTKINFTDAFIEYSTNADSETKLYPLTEDLIQIYKLVGQNNGWYNAGSWVDSSDADNWMFACYYDPAGLKADDNSDNGNGGELGNGGSNTNNNNSSNAGTGSEEINSNINNSNNNTASTIPPTGDNSFIFVLMLNFAFAVAACAVLRRKIKIF